MGDPGFSNARILTNRTQARKPFTCNEIAALRRTTGGLEYAALNE